MFLGIDCGTQGTKTVLVDLERGRVVGQGHAPHTLFSNARGAKEQSPQIWIEALKKAFAAMKQRLASNAAQKIKAIKAIGVSGQQHGLVVLDKTGRVIRPAKLWCDSETAPQNRALVQKLGGREACFQTLGLQILTGYTASKLLWLKEQEPENYQKIHRLMLPHDYLNYYLTGEYVCEPGDSSGTGFFDVKRKEWSNEVLEAIDDARELKALLPKLISPRAPAGRIRKAVAEALGLSKGVLVSSGGGDNMMGAIGSGNFSPGSLTLSIGTSGTWYTHSEKPLQTSSLIANFCASHEGWLPLVCHMNLTSATACMQQLLGVGIEEFFSLAEQAGIGAGGALLLPFFNGERVPDLPEARASLHHLSFENFTRENLARAAVEGAAFSLKYGFELLRSTEAGAKKITVIGGGAKSGFWRQLMANLTNLPVVTLKHEETAGLGAALQAAWCFYRSQEIPLKQLASAIIQIKPEKQLPDAKLVAHYQTHYQCYQATLKRNYPLSYN